MDAPFESLAPNIQARLKSIERSVAKVSTIERRLGVANLLEKFYIGIAAIGPLNRLFIQKDIGTATDFAIDFFTRGDDWVDDATKILYKEGLETAQEAIAAQLGSAFGRALPDDFVFSQTQRRMIWERARFSAESVAATFNKRIPVWIKEIRDQWIFQHGSLRGLNRWNIISRLGRPIYDWNKHRNQMIAVTEFSAQFKASTEDFWAANEKGLEIECLILPEIASDPSRDSPIICASFAGLWLPKTEAISVSFQHPQCLHHPAQSRVIGGTIPAYIRVGNYGYSLEGLTSS